MAEGAERVVEMFLGTVWMRVRRGELEGDGKVIGEGREEEWRRKEKQVVNMPRRLGTGEWRNGRGKEKMKSGKEEIETGTVVARSWYHRLCCRSRRCRCRRRHPECQTQPIESCITKSLPVRPADRLVHHHHASVSRPSRPLPHIASISCCMFCAPVSSCRALSRLSLCTPLLTTAKGGLRRCKKKGGKPNA